MGVKIINLTVEENILNQNSSNKEEVSHDRKCKKVFDYKWRVASLVVFLACVVVVLLGYPVVSCVLISSNLLAVLVKDFFKMKKNHDVKSDVKLDLILNELKDIKIKNVHSSNGNGLYQHNILLDTNVLYDSRIIDLVTDPIFKDQFCIARFVLEELYIIYRNGNTVESERARGAINNFQLIADNNEVNVVDVPRDVSKDVDVQLLDLALRMKAAILTNDGNLLSSASQKGIRVSSLKDLAESLEEPYGIGEIFKVKVVRRGKQAGEGLGFMRDGSMVVIDNAGSRIGQDVIIKIDHVNKALNGRIFFATMHDPKFAGGKIHVRGEE